MASRKEYEMLFQLNAQLGGNFNGTFKSGQSAIAAMQKEIEALSKTQSDISAFQKQQSAVEATKKKLEVLKQQYDNIQKEIQETGEFSSTLENRLLSKQQQIDKTSVSLDQQTQKLDRMGAALKDTSVDTSNLAQESGELGEEIDAVKRKQEEAADEADNFSSVASAAFSAVGQAIIAAGVAKALKEIADYFVECVDASMDFESAMIGVAKTTDMTDAELATMAAEIKQLSTEIPVVTSELAAVSEVAGQLGIAKDDLLDFSTTMSMLSTATTMAADEAATLLAQFANITQMDPSYYSNLASAIVDLGNNFATTEQKITNMSQGIAASASLAGMSEADMVALSAAVTSLGIETQAGSTSMSKLISELMTAVETGDSLVEFASIANMTADEFAKAWGDDAVTALQAFVVGLSDTERNGMSATVALTELGITETRMQRMILSLANSGDLLNNTLATSNKAWAENTALTAEAEKRYGTTQSQLTMMQNAYNNVQIAIGDALTPALRSLYGVATKVLASITGFIERNPALVQGFIAFAAVLAVVVGAITLYTAVTKIATAVSALFIATTGVALGPILAVVAGVAALAGGFVALASVISSADAEVKALTSSSRQQYYELKDVTAEYEHAKEMYGEASEEALALRYQVDDLTAAYEANKQTLEEFIAETDSLIEAHEGLISSYSESIGAINSEEQGTLALALKLQQLSEQTTVTAAEQEQMRVIIDKLNEAVPDLGLNFDSATNSINLSTEAIKGMVKAQAEQERQQEYYTTWVELTKEELALSEQLAQAQENLWLRQEELNEQGYKIDAPLIGWSTDLDDYQDEVDRVTKAYTENQDAIAYVTEKTEEYVAAQEEVANGSEELNTLIADVTERMEELAEGYTEVYDAALSSVQGQYSLWDEAADVVATSTSSINAALESQIAYWQDYNTNISSLSERTGDIEGLSSIIASFADGSADSVNAIAGMASATDEELAAMVSNWQTLQAEQETVAGSLADIETSFTETMTALQTELETTISEMDMSDVAAVSGQNTIQGFISGAEDMTPAVTAAYENIAQAAMDAIDRKLDINSPSREMEWRAEMTWAGYIGKTEAMTPELEAAMADAASAGVSAATAEQMQIVALAPLLIAAMSAQGAVSADNVGSGYGLQPVQVAVNFNFDGGASPETAAELRSYGDEFAERVREVIEDMEDDDDRRRYN